MSQVVVATFSDAGVATPLGADPMPTPGDQLVVNGIFIRVDLLATITWRNAFPHDAARRLIPSTESKTQRLRRLKRPS